MERTEQIKLLQEQLSGFSKTEIQELGKCEKYPDKYHRILPKYKDLINIIKDLYPESANFSEASSLARLGSDYKDCLCCGNRLTLNLKKSEWATYCSHTCRSIHKNTNRENIIIDNKEYESFADAANITKLTYLEIRSKIFDKSDTGSYFKFDHDNNCLQRLKAAHKTLVDESFLLAWKNDGKTITELAAMLNRQRGTVVYAFLYFGIDTKYDQLSEAASAIIKDKEKFAEVLSSMSIEVMAYKYQTSASTITKYAREYDVDTKKGYGKSKPELELYDFVKSICSDAQNGVVGLAKDSKQEIDIYIPPLNIGIEFNGCYTHSDAQREKNYHFDKRKRFFESGLYYFQIWEDDWTFNRDVVQNFIRNKLGKNDQRIGARKCVARTLTKQEFDSFMDANHMQGTCNASIMIGLIYNNEVVSAIGFKNIPVNTESICSGTGIDLIRFANSNVSGAFTKLLSFFKKTYSFDYITSFADLEIVDERKNVYNSNGFEEVGRIPADYKYFNPKLKKREHKFNYRKEKFAKLGFDIQGKTEAILAKEYGLFRCYDSGKIKYLLKT
jgi:hypothetical protein